MYNHGCKYCIKKLNELLLAIFFNFLIKKTVIRNNLSLNKIVLNCIYNRLFVCLIIIGHTYLFLYCADAPSEKYIIFLILENFSFISESTFSRNT